VGFLIKHQVFQGMGYLQMNYWKDDKDSILRYGPSFKDRF
jgi:hypothetical protein